MTRDESVEHARKFLKEHRFDVETIPLGKTRKANFRARMNRDEYIIDANYMADLARLMDTADHDERRAPSWECLSRVAMVARDRFLATTPSSSSAFRILWLTEGSGELIAYVATCLYGVRRVEVYPWGGQIVECYHYDQNIFELCPEIDAAVLCGSKAIWLMVNNFSPNRDRLRQSVLCSLFEAQIIDPVLQNGSVVFDSRESPPRDATGHAQWAYLWDRYRIHTGPVTEEYFGQR